MQPGITPKHYDLLFEPNLRRATFTGQACIELAIAKPRRALVLHAAELRIHSACVVWNARTLPAKASLDRQREQLLITLPRAIRGPAVLCLSFSGTLNDRMVGFYQSRAGSALLATTQFEAADARRAFPCVDEPAAKATFSVSIAVDSGLTALSNMPVAAKRALGRKTIFSFGRTPRMPTYLLYLGIGDFESLQSRYRRIPIRVYTTRGKKQQGRFALRCATQFLAWFERYFGIRYPLPKLDLIALPDFASGAMENWGAITFRETALLYDPKTSSAATKQRIAEVVAHELAHQWFGNLVTMRWWNDLWLNESFATFMAMKAVAALHPAWQFEEQFLLNDFAAALATDALRSSHPIEVSVRQPGEIREIFDEISYEKGASVLRMLEGYLGDAAFRAGLKRYLAKHCYANATTADLWDALAASSRHPVRRMMDSWIQQTGYPLVTVTAAGNRLRLTQQRFLFQSGQSHPGRWAIPLTAQRPLLFSHCAIALPLSLRLNPGQTAFCRIAYDAPLLGQLQARLRTLPAVDRWGAQNDLFALCIAGRVPAKRYLSFANALQGDTSYLVAAGVLGNLSALLLLAANERFAPRLAATTRRFLQPQLSRLGWLPRTTEPELNRLLRSSILLALGRLNQPAVIRFCQQAFARHLKHGGLHPDLRAAVYGTIAWVGNAKTHAQLLQLYRTAPTNEERVRLLAALASFQQPALLRHTLRFILTKEVRLQDIAIPIQRLATNPAGQPLLWPWLRSNWRLLSRRFGPGSPLLNRILKSLGALADTRTERAIARFFAKPLSGTEHALAQTRERIRINAAFLARLRKEFG